MVRTVRTSSVAVCLAALLMVHDALAQDRSAGKSKTAAAAQSTPANTATQSPEDKSSQSSTTTASEQRATNIDDSPNTRSRTRLPRYFGQLDLDEEQREDVYSIQESYQRQLDDLMQRIVVLKSEREAKFREVLKPAQQRKLSSLETSRAKKKPTSKSGTGVKQSQRTG